MKVRQILPACAVRQVELVVLLVCGLLSLALYALAQHTFPLQTLGLLQLHTLGAETKGSASYGIGLVLASGALCAFYGLGYAMVRRIARRSDNTFAPYAVVVLIPLFCAALLIWTYPITSLDIYSYIFRGLMVGHYHANTFVQTPEAYQSHPLFWYSIWRKAPTAYGPLWETTGGVTAMIVDRFGPQPLPPAPGRTDIVRYADQLITLLVSFKLVAFMGVILCALVIARMTRFPPLEHTAVRNDERLVGLYVWLWNPLVLWELVGAGHNDALMMLGVLLAYAFLAQGAPRRALLALTMGALFKAPALLFAPLILTGAASILFASAKGSLVQRWWRVGVVLTQAGLMCIALCLISFAPYWVSDTMFTNPLTRERLFSGSLATLLDLWLVHRMRWHSEAAWQLASRMSSVLLVVGALWAAWRIWRRPSQPIAASFPLMIAPLLAASVFQPWYITWALALAALQPQRARVVVLALLALSGWWVYLANDFLLPEVGWAFMSLRWQTLLVLSIYTPPLLALFAFSVRRVFPRSAWTKRQVSSQ